MPLINSERYLRIFRPKTTDGNIPKTIDGEIDYHEFHVPATKKTIQIYNNLNARRPKHLKLIIEEVANPNFKPRAARRAHQPESLRKAKANAVAQPKTSVEKKPVGRPKKEETIEPKNDVFEKAISNLPEVTDAEFEFPDDLDKIETAK